MTVRSIGCKNRVSDIDIVHSAAFGYYAPRWQLERILFGLLRIRRLSTFLIQMSNFTRLVPKIKYVGKYYVGGQVRRFAPLK